MKFAFILFLALGQPSFAATKDWCQHISAGPAGIQNPSIDFSAAVAHARFFGVQSKYSQLAEPLVNSFRSASDVFHPNLLAYSETLEGVCALPVAPPAERQASISMKGDVAWIIPGSGPVKVPETAMAVVLDFQNLPNSPHLKEYIDTAAGAALAQPISRPMRRIRSQFGMMNELAEDAYTNTPQILDQGTLEAQAPIALPIAILTGERMPAYASEVAGLLRMSQQAEIAGFSVYAAVAESRWFGIGSEGLAIRDSDLFSGGRRWPDIIPADLAATQLNDENLLGKPDPSPIPTGGDNRLPIVHINPIHDFPSSGAGIAEGAAALTLAHGTLRLFYKYFDVVGDHIDEALLAGLRGLSQKNSLTRKDLAAILGHFGQSIRDGHNFVVDLTKMPKPELPLALLKINNDIVVTRSLQADVHAGDKIISIGAVPIEQAFAEKSFIVSGATSGFHDVLALKKFLPLEGPLPIQVQTADGILKSSTLAPSPDAYQIQRSTPFDRKNGWLNEQGSPKVFYLNPEFIMHAADLESLMAEAMNADGIVLDMRGYPADNTGDEIARRLNCDSFQSPKYLIPTLTPETSILSNKTGFEKPLTGPNYDGPVVMLVGSGTVSQAEDTALKLTDAHRVTVVGRPTAGSDGDLTYVLLPGMFAFSFTGMVVRHNDGSRFAGVGVVPDYPVSLTVEDIAHGHDPDLAKAIEILRNKAPVAN